MFCWGIPVPFLTELHFERGQMDTQYISGSHKQPQKYIFLLNNMQCEKIQVSIITRNGIPKLLTRRKSLKMKDPHPKLGKKWPHCNVFVQMRINLAVKRRQYINTMIYTRRRRHKTTTVLWQKQGNTTTTQLVVQKIIFVVELT